MRLTDYATASVLTTPNATLMGHILPFLGRTIVEVDRHVCRTRITSPLRSFSFIKHIDFGTARGEEISTSHTSV